RHRRPRPLGPPRPLRTKRDRRRPRPGPSAWRPRRPALPRLRPLRPRRRLRDSIRAPMEAGDGFFARVYAAVRAIPRGRVATYGQLARLLGVPRGARAVGWALRALSPAREERVPWHRAVGPGGRLPARPGPRPLPPRRRPPRA